ncbi:DUF3108 domain-containing protein [Glaciecola sp. MH2013]|uniref:DUF3108 domain-containing protein n=1 Tax=Glaciecola sp. MH2013 TaxID=2785524 RepID=UPI00189E7E22|nr:DUF3108 domain-containing protein [Glaciecola sp. MH2013]MBF7072885.1 DUF3108 domain-containing protein [Glaciecola sp. MH2013]
MLANRWVNGLDTLQIRSVFSFISKSKRLVLLGLTLFGSALALSSTAAAYTDARDTSTKTEKLGFNFPQSFESKFHAFRHDKKIGNASLRLSQLSSTEFQLNYESKVSRYFLSDKRSEETVFSYQDNRIMPVSYTFHRKGTGPNKSLKVTFDSKEKIIKIDDQEDQVWEGEYDNQLFRIDISRQLALGKSAFDYKFLNYRGQKREYNIEVVETESLALPYGTIDAVKVKVNRGSNKRQTYAWFAPSLDYVLVRIQQFKDGEEQGDIRLSSYNKQ